MGYPFNVCSRVYGPGALGIMFLSPFKFPYRNKMTKSSKGANNRDKGNVAAKKPC